MYWYTLTCVQRNFGRRIWREVDHDIRGRIKRQEIVEWVESYTLQEWIERPLRAIEESMAKGHCFLIRNTGIDAGFGWDKKTAAILHKGPTKVDVQGTFSVHYEHHPPNQFPSLRRQAAAQWHYSAPEVHLGGLRAMRRPSRTRRRHELPGFAARWPPHQDSASRVRLRTLLIQERSLTHKS